MTTIWKYRFDGTLDHGYVASFFIPKGAKILTVQMQDDVLCLWALADEGMVEKTVRHFIILGTGMADSVLQSPLDGYIGTVQEHPSDGNVYTWHVFEIG